MQQVRQNSYPSIRGSQYINQPSYVTLAFDLALALIGDSDLVSQGIHT